MKSTVESLSPTRVKLTVEVPFEELKPSLDAAYQSIGSQVTDPGFRKGKVPPQVIDQRVGRGAGARGGGQRGAPEALLAGGPRARGQGARPARGRRHRVRRPKRGAAVHRRGRRAPRDHAARPATASRSRSTTSRSPTTRSTSRSTALRAAVRHAEAGRARRSQTATSSPSTWRPPRTARRSRTAQATGMSYQVGSGQLLDGLDEAVTGLDAGETHDLRHPAGRRRALRARTPTSTVTVTAVKEQELPELDDEFAQTAPASSTRSRS